MITVSPVSGALGAEIDGIDLSQPLSEQQIADIRAALLEHLVIFFRNQDITPADHLRFASYFSEPEDYPMITGLADFPKIVPVVKLPHERVNFGGLWHSDTAYTDIPPMGAVLVARELPPFGGDTLFANMYLAYEQLSDGLKRLLSGLRAVNSSAKAEVTATREDRLATDAKLVPGEELIGVHPVVRTHPETGRKLLYVNYGHTVRFEDMTEQESKPLLDYLFAHLCRPEFTCRFRWEPGSIAFWDNRAVQHNPINDYHGHKRVMHRISLRGSRPY
ncbi:MAG TPA: taurine dioxygenase [Alphaproteobacteria bacterium]|jgi:taurine dioxygenase|nr:taurine dioxygenase [Alphaproteobacteria bacterium]HAM48356.1 taurine dioxygenase [Alphaproteobacteria bacterium]HBA42676.1 taurine dioxygenase [Alphaproteobacteria bacterium]HBF98418.1 taurine dioxygenase [Alphaproteobacteria bacterium]HCO91770.1 taurine dioxygenase [Alphaproteobacteria bacterium]